MTQFDHDDWQKALFRPRRVSPDANTVWLPVQEGIRLGAQWHPAGKTDPILLLFHGNGETAADYGFLVETFHGLRLNLLVVDFRGYGVSDGLPTARSMLDDAHAVYARLPEFTRERDVAPSAVIVMGRSLGSACAIELAAHARPRPAALILDSPFAETWTLVRRLGGTIPQNAVELDCFANESKMSSIDQPCLIIHGENDQIICNDESRRLHQSAQSMHKRLLVVPTAGHNNLLAVDATGYFKAFQALMAHV